MHYSYVMYMLNNIIINLYVCIYTNIYIYFLPEWEEYYFRHLAHILNCALVIN